MVPPPRSYLVERTTIPEEKCNKWIEPSNDIRPTKFKNVRTASRKQGRANSKILEDGREICGKFRSKKGEGQEDMGEHDYVHLKRDKEVLERPTRVFK